MKPQSITRLASLFILAVAGFIVLLGTFLWIETERVSREIRARAEQSKTIMEVTGADTGDPRARGTECLKVPGIS